MWSPTYTPATLPCRQCKGTGEVTHKGKKNVCPGCKGAGVRPGTIITWTEVPDPPYLDQ